MYGRAICVNYAAQVKPIELLGNPNVKARVISREALIKGTFNDYRNHALKRKGVEYSQAVQV